MTKASVVCEACGENNPPNSEFCTGCGSKLPSFVPSQEIKSLSDKEAKYQRDREKYFKAVPTLFAVIAFLLFIDYVDTKSIEWAFYPGAAILLFAIIAPYFTYRKKSPN